jgi:hypothetical protein
MGALEQCARERHLSELIGYVLRENDSMRQMMLARGYVPHNDEDDAHVISFVLPLRDKADAQEARAA